MAAIENSSNRRMAGAGRLAATENTVAEGGLRRIPGLSENWTSAEQSALEDLLEIYSSEKSAVELYAKIALILNHKSIRDIACRCRWMSDGRRVKTENDGSSGKKTGVRVSPPVTGSGGGGVNPRGRTAELIEMNYRILDQIQRNLGGLRMNDNIALFRQCVTDIDAILESMPTMRRMPPLPMIDRPEAHLQTSSIISAK